MNVPATTGVTATAPASTTNSALGSLSGNLSNFLNLLMVQLQHQDPTSPMDTNAFTSQLVQYSSVEQQINTNTNLTSLITATQSNTMLQSSALVGKQVTASSDHLALQNGQSQIHFTAPSSEPVTITVTSASGETVLKTVANAVSGNNDWSWNGQDGSGQQLNDGAYQVTVADRSGVALATTVTGKVTGMTRSGTTVSALMGGLQTDVNTIQSVVSTSGGA